MPRSKILCLNILALSVLGEACSSAPVRNVSSAKRGSSNTEAEGGGKGTKTPENLGDGGGTVGSGGGQGGVDPIVGTEPDPIKPEPIDPDPMEADPIDKAPSAHLESDFISSFIDEIADKSKKGRGTGTAENKAVAQKIAEQFKELGLKPGGDNNSYFQAFSAKGKPTNNIIGILPGESDEYIVLGAHMDHIGIVNGQINPGADDNASGTTGVVASARAFLKNQVKLKRSIVFMLYSGEEMGLLGSIYFVKNPTINMKKVKFMVNLDMIGRYRPEKPMEVIGVEKTIEGNQITRDLISKSGIKSKYIGEVSAGGSDHMPFKQIGIPIAFLHTGLHNEYHKPGDTVEKIDKKSLQTIAGIGADLAYELAKIDNFTSASFAYAPIELDGYTDGIHHQSCEPGLVTFEEVQNNLSSLRVPH